MSELTTTATSPVSTRDQAPRAPVDFELPKDLDEHDLYPIHAEDNVPENPRHERQARYLRGALAAHLSGKWVTGDLCMYWEERNFHQYAAPDVLVVDCPPPEDLPSVHLRWSDPPALLVIEVGCKSTFVRDEGPKLETYGLDLKVPEYLYYHPDRRDLRFWRLGEKGYVPVAPDARGFVHSETLDLWFGADEGGRLQAHSSSGERLLSHEEERGARQNAERRAEALVQRVAELEAQLARGGQGQP